MTDIIRALQQRVEKGEAPTVEEMFSALQQMNVLLAQAIAQRDGVRAITNDMGEWLVKIAAAHLAKDAISLKKTLDAYVAKHIHIINSKENRQLH